MTTWRLGIYKSDDDRLTTVYVGADGQPVPYERKRVGEHKLLLTGTFTGMPYREARAALLKQAAEQKIEGKLGGRRPPVRAALDPASRAKRDKGVLRLTSTPTKDGWKSRGDILIAPDGTRYIRVSDHQKADMVFGSEEFGDTRYRILDERPAPVTRRERAMTKVKAIKRGQRVGKRRAKAAGAA